jgi:parallel beta-helix repeat protein
MKQENYVKFLLKGLIMLCLINRAIAATIYVDPSLSAQCPATYSVGSRECASGTAAAYDDINDALAAAQPGDEVILRGGNHNPISPKTSGSPGLPILIQGYSDENVTISDMGSIALSLINVNDLIIDGLNIRNVLGFGRLENSTRITIRNTSFTAATATGTTGALKLVRSTHNTIINNILQDGSDVVLLQDASDYNKIIGNTFDTASHSLMSIRCSNHNLIRGNVFSNPQQKAMEIYDCEGISDAPYRLNSTKRNVIENNQFINTLAYHADHRYNAIQHGGQHAIVRNNIFRNCEGGGVNYSYYSDESLYVYGNRMYNNTFYDNSCYAIIGNKGPSDRYYDNRVVNNLLYKNTGCSGEEMQIRISDPSAVILSNNASTASDPGFASESELDFRLKANSSYIDAGQFLTKAKTAGTGNAVEVVDSGFFYDGFSISGEEGDLIQLAGENTIARIESIDYSRNIITLDRDVSWIEGQGIGLVYAGVAPDVGAYEFISSSSVKAPPMPPEDFNILD